MTLVFEDSAVNEPCTHAFVVGVGCFPNLKGQNQELPEELRVVDDVTSPPNNARAIVKWLITNRQHISPPLRSIELLISETNSGQSKYRQKNIDKADGENVKACLDDWVTRCEENENNLAFFYGSSHGVQAQEHVLLLEDIGSDKNDPWQNTVSINHLHTNFYGKINLRTVIFADCCRNLSESGESSVDGVTGKRIGNITKRELVRGKSDPRRAVYVLRATPLGVVAKATRGGLGYFTAALLECLKGAGSENHPMFGWSVTPENLRRAVEYAGRHGLDLPDDDMVPRGEEAYWVGDPFIIKLDQPRFPVRVRESGLDNGRATLELAHPNNGVSVSRAPSFNGDALCTWVPPDFEMYNAAGEILIAENVPTVKLHSKSFLVIQTGPHDIQLSREE